MKKSQPTSKKHIKRTQIAPELKSEWIPSKSLHNVIQNYQLEFARDFVYGNTRGTLTIHGINSGKILTVIICAEMFLDKNKDSEKKHHIVIITPTQLSLDKFKQELYTYKPDITDDERYKFYTYDNFSRDILNRKSTRDICKNSMLIVDNGEHLRPRIRTYVSLDLDTKTKMVSATKIIKSGSKVYHALENCVMVADKILVLSNNSISSSPEDIENLISLINGTQPLNLNGRSFNNLWSNPTIAQQYFGGRLSLFEHSPAIHNEYFPKMIELCVEIIMNNKTLDDYNELEKKFPSNRKKINMSKDFGIHLGNAYDKIARASNLIGGAHSQKLNFLISFINGVLSKEPNSKIGLSKKMIDTHTDKCIIFTHFSKKKNSKLIIDRLKAENISYDVINSTTPKTEIVKIVDDYNSGKIKILLILGLDDVNDLKLFETGFVFIFEPNWNNFERELTKDISVHFMSHTNLPVEKRNILILSLFLIKPDEKELFGKLLRGDDDVYTDVENLQRKKHLSVDLKSFILSNIRQDFLDTSLNKLRKILPPIKNRMQIMKHFADY